ncbi:hypothetical protein ACFSC4_28230 [Deinococcus malanensis]|uniref:hypothetical protein n=1 Tax=Deinococcus malanensis TaxID=1706855 RepID=UPI00363C5017
MIVSHAHLPLLSVLSGPARALRDAELLIIDENPTSSLIVTADTLVEAGLARLTPSPFWPPSSKHST